MERISLANAAFEGNNNAYLFADGPETVLVDTGDRMESTREELAARLADHGVRFADVDCVFLTHWHGDHAGLAGEIQAESDATVYVHTADAALVAGDEDAWADLHALQQRYFEAWGMPPAERSVLRERIAGQESMGTAPTVTPVEDGDAFRFDGHELRVVHASGHADGLCLFEFDLDGRRDVLSGDALLPVYTPNVGGADVRVERPLETYLRALRGIVEADYDRAWPGHRHPIDAPAERAEYIIHHHEERAWRVLDALDRLGPSTTWEVSAELFGDLEGIHVLHGPGESYAHLEHLERAGAVVRDGTAYRLADGTAEALETADEARWPLAH